ncbi:hypothetical protein V8E55_009076 [Tylopilus felleus]
MVLIRFSRCALSGTPSPMTRDPHLAKSLPPPIHVFATPATPTPVNPTQSQSPRYPTQSSLGRDDTDKETETDHDYESTTTTTDSDPPPHTPIGTTTTSHCVGALQLHGDDDVEVQGVDVDAEHAAASMMIRLPGPSTPVKLLGRFSMSPSPSLSPDSPDSHRDGCESPKGAVVFPSLNGSFCQGSSSHMSGCLSSPGTSAQTTPAGTMTPVSSSSLSSSWPGHADEEDSKMKPKSQGLEASVSGDGDAFMQSRRSPSSTSPRPGLRKDSHGFWEPVTPVSPSSSSSSLPLSPFEGKTGTRFTSGWMRDKTGSEEGSESPESTPPSTLSVKSRSLSPGPDRVSGTDATRASSSKATSSPTSGSDACSPSPSNGSSSIPANPTTLLPAFLTTATVKRKKASRTREIVDRLRSSSVDMGKDGGGLDSSGWLASPSKGGEGDGKLGKVSSGSDQVVGNHAGGRPPSSSSSPPPSQSNADSGKKDGQALSSKSSESGAPGKSNRTTQVVVPSSEIHSSYTSSRTATTTTTSKASITPFPILSVSQSPVSDFTTTRQSQIGGTGGPMPHNTDVSKMNTTVSTSLKARNGPQLVPSTPNGGGSPSTRTSHLLHPSPPHPAVHPLPALGPSPPIVAVPAYPHPMYVPFTPYHLAPPPQAPPRQGTWVAVYPGRPPHMHPQLPAHVAPITGVSGMRHVSW